MPVTLTVGRHMVLSVAEHEKERAATGRREKEGDRGGSCCFCGCFRKCGEGKESKAMYNDEHDSEVTRSEETNTVRALHCDGVLAPTATDERLPPCQPSSSSGVGKAERRFRS